MVDLLNLPIDKLAGISFECDCGRKHTSGIKKIYIGPKAGSELLKTVTSFNGGEILFLADSNTWKAAGREIFELLAENKFKVKYYIFNGPGTLVPDEKAIGRLLIETGNGTSLIIAAGSGTLNDLSRYISSRLAIPYIIVCTAPSMDGYTSTVSPLIVGGYKKTFEASYPYAVIADEHVIKRAPVEMIRAGFGDMIGKYTALSDWELSYKINGEHLCPVCEALTKKALGETVSGTEFIRSGNKHAVILFNSLILSGISMGLFGNSRPASGSEHHLAHYWEMKAISEGSEHPLHGSAVGVGTIVISTIYESLGREDGLPSTIGPRELTDLLTRAGSVSDPDTLGIKKNFFMKVSFMPWN